MNDLKVDVELDCSGMNCPLPVLKTKKAVATMESGQILKMISTDPGSNQDMPSWSDRTGNPILKSDVDGDKHIYYIQCK